MNSHTSTSVEELESGVKSFVRLVGPYADFVVRGEFRGRGLSVDEI